MADRTWHSVFTDLSEACGTLSYYRLELLNDPEFVGVIDGGLHVVCMREENEAKAIRDLLGNLTPPSEKAKEAMRRFCDRHRLKDLLLSGDGRGTSSAVGHMRQPPTWPDAIGNPAQPQYHRPNKIVAAFSRAFRSPSLREGMTDIIGGGGERRTIRETPLSLPVQCLCFGRSTELDTMSQALYAAKQPTHFAIVGGGGMGKTSLANALAHDDRVANAFQHRRYWVNLEDCSTCKDLVQSVGKVLPISKDSDIGAMRAFLASSGALLVLDDLDTFAAEELSRTELGRVLDLLASTCCLVITLRDAHPLPTVMTWRKTIRLGRLDRASATQIFCAAADTHTHDPDLGALIEQCDGLPLALRLLSRQARAGEPLSQLRRRWDEQSHQLLSKSVPGTKLDSLAVSIELTLAHPRARSVEDTWTLLRLLAPVSEGLTFEQIEELYQSSGVPKSLGDLLDLGLVLSQRILHSGSSGPQLHYSIVAPVRRYIYDTVKCPSVWMIRQALGAEDRVRYQVGALVRRMGLFELMNTPLVPQGLGILCIGISPKGTIDSRSCTFNARFRLRSHGKLYVVPEAAAICDGVDATPRTLWQRPVADVISGSLFRLRHQGERKDDTSSFDCTVIRRSATLGRANTESCVIGPPTYICSQDTWHEAPEFSEKLEFVGFGEILACFVMPPIPDQVIIEITKVEVDRRQESYDAGSSCPQNPPYNPIPEALKSWTPEELSVIDAVLRPSQPGDTLGVSVSDCDRICTYYDYCLEPLRSSLQTMTKYEGKKAVDGRRRSRDFILEELGQAIIPRRCASEAFAIALCIHVRDLTEARRRLRAGHGGGVDSSDLGDFVERYLVECTKLVASFDYARFDDTYELCEGLRPSSCSKGPTDRLVDLGEELRPSTYLRGETDRVLDLCEAALDALERVCRPPPRQTSSPTAKIINVPQFRRMGRAVFAQIRGASH